MRLYRFLSGPDDSSFCHKVTAALNKGWHLYGSPTHVMDPKKKVMRCGQAAHFADRERRFHAMVSNDFRRS